MSCRGTPARGARLAFAALTIVAGTTRAQEASDPHAVQPERPTVATDAGTVAPGWLEIETGLERDRFGPSLTTGSTPTVFKFGCADHAQLSVFGSAQHNPGVTGLRDVGVGVKWRIADDASFFGDFAILPSVKFPTGSAEKGIGGPIAGSLGWTGECSPARPFFFESGWRWMRGSSCP
jgi:hypothetical protein